MANLFCRICGFEHVEPQWGTDGRCPLYEICPCCGAESGYEDCTALAIHSYRKAWLAKGTPWFSPKSQPANWNVVHQLENIPPEFR